MTFPISDYIQPVLRQSYELRQSNCRGFKTLTSYHAQHEYSFYLAFVEYEATVADLESSVPSRRKSGCQLNSSQDIDTQPTGRLRLFQSGQLASRLVLRAFLSGKPCINPNLFFNRTNQHYESQPLLEYQSTNISTQVLLYCSSGRAANNQYTLSFVLYYFHLLA